MFANFYMLLLVVVYYLLTIQAKGNPEFLAALAADVTMTFK